MGDGMLGGAGRPGGEGGEDFSGDEGNMMQMMMSGGNASAMAAVWVVAEPVHPPAAVQVHHRWAAAVLRADVDEVVQRVAVCQPAVDSWVAVQVVAALVPGPADRLTRVQRALHPHVV